MKLPDWCAMPFALAWSVRNSTLISEPVSSRSSRGGCLVQDNNIEWLVGTCNERAATLGQLERSMQPQNGATSKPSLD